MRVFGEIMYFLKIFCVIWRDFQNNFQFQQSFFKNYKFFLKIGDITFSQFTQPFSTFKNSQILQNVCLIFGNQKEHNI